MPKSNKSILLKEYDEIFEEEADKLTGLMDIGKETVSLWSKIDNICTMANESAVTDLRIFLFTIQQWNIRLPTIYLYCTTSVKDMELDRDYKGKIVYNTSLDRYTGLNRQQMELSPSHMGYKNLFHDFTVEKCNLMEWAFSVTNHPESGLLFCDADICWFGPLPEVDMKCHYAFSAHEIHPMYEEKYGIYNAGFIWFQHKESINIWRNLCMTSRFFEQAALEDIPKGLPPWIVQKFPTTINYGWWRLYQGNERAETLKLDWSIKRHPLEYHSGLLVKGQPLICAHTHWITTDMTTATFNFFLIEKLQLLIKQKKVVSFLRFLARLGSDIASNAIRSKKK